MNRMDGRISIDEVAKFLNVSKKTLRRWDASGKFVAHRDPNNNRRYYTHDQLQQFRNGHSKYPEVKDRIAVYVRVPDFNMDRLDKQEIEVMKYLRNYDSTIDISAINVYTDYGYEYDFSRPGFNKLLYDAASNKIDKIVVLDETILCGVFSGWFTAFLDAIYSVKVITCEEALYDPQRAMYSIEGMLKAFTVYGQENSAFRSSAMDCLSLLRKRILEIREFHHCKQGNGISDYHQFNQMTAEKIYDAAVSSDNFHSGRISYGSPIDPNIANNI
jgi:predicted site-specific integrase-resolvase